MGIEEKIEEMMRAMRASFEQQMQEQLSAVRAMLAAEHDAPVQGAPDVEDEAESSASLESLPEPEVPLKPARSLQDATDASETKPTKPYDGADAGERELGGGAPHEPAKPNDGAEAGGPGLGAGVLSEPAKPDEGEEAGGPGLGVGVLSEPAKPDEGGDAGGPGLGRDAALNISTHNRFSVLAHSAVEEARELCIQGEKAKAQLTALRDRERVMAAEMIRMERVAEELRGQLAKEQAERDAVLAEQRAREGVRFPSGIGPQGGSYLTPQAGSCGPQPSFGSGGPLVSPLACLVHMDTRSRLGAPVGADGEMSVTPADLKAVSKAVDKVPILKERDAKDGQKLLSWTEQVREALSIFPREKYGRFFVSETKGRMDLQVQTRMRSRLGNNWGAYNVEDGLAKFFQEVALAYCPSCARQAVTDFNKAVQEEHEEWDVFLDRLLKYQALSTLHNDTILDRVDITLAQVVQRALQTAKPELKLRLEDKLEQAHLDVQTLTSEEDVQLLRRIVRRAEEHIKQHVVLYGAGATPDNNNNNNNGDKGGNPHRGGFKRDYKKALPFLSLMQSHLNIQLPDLKGQSNFDLQSWWQQSSKCLRRPGGVEPLRNMLQTMQKEYAQRFKGVQDRVRKWFMRRIEAKANYLGLAKDFTGPPLYLKDRTHDKCSYCDKPLKEQDALGKWHGWHNCSECHLEASPQHKRNYQS